MISFLRGKIKSIDSGLMMLDVNGIGYEINVSNWQVYTTGQEIEIQIYYHWHQENGPQLFGFDSSLSRKVFSLIISVSGIGPKIGLAILNQMSPEQFLQAITLADFKALSSISGIGAKKAELMVIQLKDKISKMAPMDMVSIEGATLTKIKELSQALDSLNYSRAEINSALDYVKKSNIIEKATFDELLRKSLTYLAKRV